MAKAPASSTAADISVTKLSTPRIFLVRMLVFLVLCSLLLVVLYKQIWVAFLANPAFPIPALRSTAVPHCWRRWPPCSVTAPAGA